MFRIRSAAIWVLIIGSILIALPLIVYWFNFSSLKIATYPSAWGIFGDFVGGILNPIIGLVNLALLLIITLYIRYSHESVPLILIKVYHPRKVKLNPLLSQS